MTPDATGAAARAAARRRQEQAAATARAHQAAHWRKVRAQRRVVARRIARIVRGQAFGSSAGLLDALAQGSRRVLRRWVSGARRFVARSGSTGDRVFRLGVLAGAAVGALLLVTSRVGVLLIAAPIWGVVAIRAHVTTATATALRNHLLSEAEAEEEKKDLEEEGEEEGGAPAISLEKEAAATVKLTPDQMVTDTEGAALLREVIGHRSAAHLVELTGPLTTLTGEGWESGHIRALAGRLGVPTPTTRSATRAGSTTGIRSRDLPPPPPGDPQGGVVDPGQSINNNINNAPSPCVGEGLDRGPEPVVLRHDGLTISYPTGRTTTRV